MRAINLISPSVGGDKYNLIIINYFLNLKKFKKLK